MEAVVDFVSSHPDAQTVLRVIAVNPKLPTYPPLNLEGLRPACKTYREIKVGGKNAATCVTCGRGACSWTVHVPGPPDLSIVSLNREASAASEPEDGPYPLKSMIDSIRFDSTPVTGVAVEPAKGPPISRLVRGLQRRSSRSTRRRRMKLAAPDAQRGELALSLR
jgi:hypothetical protein